jgi:threonine synthase
MQYFSLAKNAPAVNFKTATILGQAPDKGLYFPETLPVLSPAFIKSLSTISKNEMAFKVMKPYVGDVIPDSVLQTIVHETLDFDIPLVPIQSNIASLELFHGPTLAFKDVGARFMSRCLGYFSKTLDATITVLVATSGDTGGAVANGFLGVPGVEVVILYPSGKVSPVQELQLTTCGSNITALEIDGSFDDCQAIVKAAFMDPDLKQKLFLTSANSINVARWLPQQLYYFIAYQEWIKRSNGDKPPVISVPSGNFGNICAGLLAKKTGLPLGHFIAACNINDVVPQYLATGSYLSVKAQPTISNAMDVGDPSNFVRIMELFSQSLEGIQQHISGDTISDAITAKTIQEVYAQTGYILDPHGAVAYKALQNYLMEYPLEAGFILETAHPVKFPEVVEASIGHALTIPDLVKPLFSKEKISVQLPASFEAVKDWLMPG